ncbi:hypothetical protein ACFWDI_18945 [Streptomyces sp. NPDC060064]|uniref:DNA polymerase III subunit beta family protein n=1 Tax=Streptomyces sp. NPDC060064 TaxID=3347049 RepID=UPI003697988F
MSITINAHQLGRLIDQTASHMGGEYVEPLHGIRLDVDATHLYAVASDRYTLAASRYRLNHDDKGQEPFAVTLPADHIASVREWLRAMDGAAWVTLDVTDARLIFKQAQTELAIAVSLGLEFPNWRGLFRGIAEQAVEDAPFPALQSEYLSRWADTGHILRVRVSADLKAVLLFGEDFIGAMMPARYAGVGPVTDETFDSARSLWKDILAADGETADMVTDMPAEDPNAPRYEATKDVRETGESLLQEVLNSTRDVHDADYDDDRDLWFAHIRIGVANWMAYRYLDALHNADPRKAAEIVADVAEQLDSGEIGEWAWDTAEESGYTPQKWHDEHEAHVAKQMAEEPRKWAVRLARALNDAKDAGITFSVEANEHVAHDEKAEQWAAVKPEPATA